MPWNSSLALSGRIRNWNGWATLKRSSAIVPRGDIFPRLDGTVEAVEGVRQAPHAVWLDVAVADPFPELLVAGPDDPLKRLVSLFKLRWFDPAVLKERLQRYLPSLTRSQAGEAEGGPDNRCGVPKYPTSSVSTRRALGADWLAGFGRLRQ